MIPKYYQIDTNQTIIFTVDAGSPSPSLEPIASQDSEPFNTKLIATASEGSVAIVCLGLSVYFKKHHH